MSTTNVETFNEGESAPAIGAPHATPLKTAVPETLTVIES